MNKNTLGNYLGSIPKETPSSKKSNRIIDYTVGIGVELELENIVSFYDGELSYEDYPEGLEPPIKSWVVVQDGSLREGTEFIFKGPLCGKDIVNALDSMKEFLSVFKRKGKGVTFGPRCSVHVHLDSRTKTAQQILDVISLYILVEKILFLYTSPLRSKNNYCRPLTDSNFKEIYLELSGFAKEDRLTYFLDRVRNKCDKYSALNLLPLTSYGSLEFRHHQGTNDMDRILDWVNIILCINQASSTISINKLISLSETPLEFIRTVFKGTSINEEWYTQNKVKIDHHLTTGRIDLLEMLNLNVLTNYLNNTPSKKKNLLSSFKQKNLIDNHSFLAS